MCLKEGGGIPDSTGHKAYVIGVEADECTIHLIVVLRNQETAEKH